MHKPNDILTMLLQVEIHLNWERITCEMLDLTKMSRLMI